MHPNEHPECITADTRVRRPQYVRYRIPCGLAEEVLHEAQQRKISPSAVISAVLTRGLSSFAAEGVAHRVRRAVQAAQPCAGPAAAPNGNPSILSTPIQPDTSETRHV